SEPAMPTRLELEVGASYLSTPADVKMAMLDAMSHVSRVLTQPPPEAFLHAFDGSAITYRARFWVDDFEHDDKIKDEVRTAIFYAFSRSGIEIPWPIEVGCEREWPEPDEATKRRRRDEALSEVDLFSRLTSDQRSEMAAGTVMRLFGD